ncbi:type II secretion system protein GspM [Pseudomonas fluorescens]|uniref:type II secretion system protein GspM n=1 Tax=Pseudomonas fluorescens TaxID=294 RepID=UPI0035267215
MKAAWQRLSIRERRLLLAMVSLVLGALAFSLIWQPVRQRLPVVERQYQQQVALANQLQRAQPQHLVAQVSDQPLSLRISDSAAAAGLELQQMDSDSELLRLTVSGDVTKLLHWLDHAERHGAALQSLTLEKRDAVLEARVVFR